MHNRYNLTLLILITLLLAGCGAERNMKKGEQFLVIGEYHDAANQFNLEVNAYVGGIVGYNDTKTRLTIRNATNGSQNNAASVGSLKMRGETGTLGSGVSLKEYNGRFNYNDYAGGKDARGSMAGGIIGCVTQNTTLEGCTNYGIVSHKSAAGGIAGWNDGSINGCSTYATLGTQQDGYAYLGGIVGINSGAVTNSAPAASITVRGRYIIGGVAGLNLTGASITYNTSNKIPVTVQANECAGGVAGVNCGSIALGGTTLQVNITAESYAGGIAGSNNTRNATTASIAPISVPAWLISHIVGILSIIDPKIILRAPKRSLSTAPV